MKYAALYGTSSIQRLVDFVKIACSFEGIVPVVLKPIGAAAQIGVPEAYRHVYRVGRPLIVLLDINDLHEALGVREVYYVDSKGAKKSVKEIGSVDNIAIVVSGGEGEPSKKELERASVVQFEEVPPDLPPLATISIILYLLSRLS